MSQTTITSFFNSRKRPASEDIVSSKSKIAHIDCGLEINGKPIRRIIKASALVIKDIKQDVAVSNGIKSEELKKSGKTTVQQSPSKKLPEQSTATAFAKKQNVSNINKFNEPSKPESVSSSRKELSLGDIRKKLASSSRLAELRATAERLSRGIQELKETSDKRNLKEFKSIDVEVPSRYCKHAFKCTSTYNLFFVEAGYVMKMILEIKILPLSIILL